MRSKISIDIDEDNKPIIILDYVKTDDVRDKLIGSFIHGFKHEGTKASVEFTEVEDMDISYASLSEGRKKKRLIFRPTTEN